MRLGSRVSGVEVESMREEVEIQKQAEVVCHSADTYVEQTVLINFVVF